MLAGWTVEKAVDHPNAAACVANRLREPQYWLIRPFALVDCWFIFVFGVAV
jgi:hypothetical protein